MIRAIASALVFLFLVATSFSQNDGNEVTFGTTTYDAESVKNLFQEYKAKNEEKAKEAPAHLSQAEIIRLKAFQVRADRIENEADIRNKLDPNPENRIRRLARVDPAIANELRVSQRADYEFFAGTNDPGAQHTGVNGNLTSAQMGNAFQAALSKLNQLFGRKKK